MRIAIRTDASVNIGTGHVMRCLALANAVRGSGASIMFLCRQTTTHLTDLINVHGHQVMTLGNCDLRRHDTDDVTWEDDVRLTRAALAARPVDWLVVDHYALDLRWEKALRPYCKRLLVIDDLADRPHDCDLLLDANLGRRPEHYDPWLPKQVPRLIGPMHALLRPDFAAYRAESLARRSGKRMEHILIAMGGIDKDNATGQILTSISRSDLPANLHITLVMGSAAPWLADVKEQAARLPCATSVTVDADDIARRMSLCDLALGAAGGTAWERCCLGLPSLLLVIADNQRHGAQALAQSGAAQVFESPEALCAQALTLARRPAPRLLDMIQAAACITDGRGCERVARAMGEQLV